MFAAPYMVSPGTIKNLHGRANVIDFAPLWNSISPYPRAIYYIGDLNCHQLSNRTIYLNDNEMPVCARDVSIFVFINAGLAAALLAVPSASISLGVLNIFPKRIRDYICGFRRGPIMFVLILLAVLLLPTAIDGFRQMLTNYESTNLTRLLTGAPCGFAGGFYLGVTITSVREIDRIRKDVSGNGAKNAEDENHTGEKKPDSKEL